MLNDKIIQHLIQPTQELKLTMLSPTHRYGHQVLNGKDALNLKNNLKEARHYLQQRGWEAKRIRKFLTPARELLDNETFWANQSDGLAIYLSESEPQILTLPVHFDNIVYLSESYYIKPLGKLMNPNDRFFILCLSQNKIAFYEARAHSITPVKISDLVPMGMEEMDFEQEVPVLQMHGGSQASPQFHGQGGRKDKQEMNVEKYIRSVDEGLMKMLHDEQVPMVFMGVDELFAGYKQVNSYDHMLESHVSGNPFSWGPAAIHERAWKIASAHFDEQKQEAIASFDNQQHLNTTSTQPTDILFAAHDGRVENLYTRDDQNLWGSYDPESRKLSIHPMRTPTSECLLNAATLQALRTDAQVFNLPKDEMKSFEKSPIAATFRY